MTPWRGAASMCGRTTHLYTWREIHELYRLTARPGLNIRASTNVAPTEDVHAVMPGAEHNSLVSARWGLVPRWWKKPLRELPATFKEVVPRTANLGDLDIKFAPLYGVQLGGGGDEGISATI